MISHNRSGQLVEPKIPSLQMPLPATRKKSSVQKRQVTSSGRGQNSRQSSAGSSHGASRSQSTQNCRGSSGRHGKIKVKDVMSLPIHVAEAEYDSDENGQNIKFIDVPSSAERALLAPPTPRDIHRINPETILSASQESDPSKVYEINLHTSSIKHIEQLEVFDRVRVLDLSGNYIDKIQHLDENKELRELKLYGNKIKQIQNLDNLKELCNLQLQHNYIKSLGRGLVPLRRLRQLRLDSNQIERLEPKEVACCPQIITLDLSCNRLDTINAVCSLPNLEELSVRHNKLRAITDLTRCRRLQEVDISHNQLTDISGLKGLSLLLTVNASHNLLISVKSLGKLKGLQELLVNHNRLTTVTPVADLFPALQILDVASNCIEDVMSLNRLDKLTELAELTASGNPCAHHEGYASLAGMLSKLEMLDGVCLKKPSARPITPLMRPMTASTVITTRHVESQLRNMEHELDSFSHNLNERFQSLRASVVNLPANAPPSTSHSLLSTPDSLRPKSKCGKRSRIALAQAYAAQHGDASPHS